MNLFNPNTGHTNNVYEKGRYILIWNLSIIVCFIFIITSLLYFSFDRIIFSLYLIMFLTSVFSLFYLKKYKNAKPIFWLYTIITSGILIGSFQTLHHIIHYDDILWTICIILFAFIGLEYKYALRVALIHALSYILFIIYNLNTNIAAIKNFPEYQLLVFSIESTFAFAVFIILIHHYLKYQKFTRAELGKTQTKYQNVIENINEALIQDDRDGKIIFCNTKFLEMFEYTESDVQDIDITEIINSEFHNTIRLRHYQRINGMRNFDQHLYLGKTKKGNLIWMEINVTPLIENGRIIGTQSLIRDVTNKKEQELQLLKINKELIEIEEAERERIAYEIHDGLSQMLIATRIHTEFGSSKEKILKMLDTAIVESRTITQNLVPKDLIEFGLIHGISLLTKKTSESTHLKIKFKCDCEYEFTELSEYVQFNIYRVIQEFMNNAVKHAKANQIQIEFSTLDNNLTILFSNDGGIIPDDKLKSETFLIAIKRRLKILNGNFNITFNRNGKVAFFITIPFDSEASSLKKVI